MKSKLLFSDYDEKTGISKATIQNRYGIVSATSKIHPEDKDHASRFLGCEIAELKAIRKSILHEIKNSKKILMILKDIIEKSTNDNSETKDISEVQSNGIFSTCLINEVNRQINKINNLYNQYVLYQNLIISFSNIEHLKEKNEFENKLNEIFKKLEEEIDKK